MTCESKIDWANAYRLYMDGLTYREICDALGISLTHPHNASIRIKKYAKKNFLPYPRTAPTQYAYCLYINGMNTQDIGLLFSVTSMTARNWINAYAQLIGDTDPLSLDKNAFLSYNLRRQSGLTYREIAKIVGYFDASSCYRAVRNLARKRGLPL